MSPSSTPGGPESLCFPVFAWQRQQEGWEEGGWQETEAGGLHCP